MKRPPGRPPSVESDGAQQWGEGPWVSDDRVGRLGCYKLGRLHEREALILAELERVRSAIDNPASWAVDDLELGMRAYNCLRNLATHDGRPLTWPTPKIATIADLQQWSARDLLKIKNLGRLTLLEIESVLADLGLALSP